MISPPSRHRSLLACAAIGSLLLGGCASLSTWLPSWVTSPPWAGPDERKVGPLPAFEPKATARVSWQVPLGGKGTNGFVPAIRPDVIYAAGQDGDVVSVDPATGRARWHTPPNKGLSGGVGADDRTVVAGTKQAEVVAFDASGKSLWQAKVSSEIAGPPQVAEGIVAVWSIDGRIYGLSATDGSRKWVYQRTNPSLTVRRYAAGVITRGAIFTGTAGGKLLGLDLATGALGWEANVTTPKGSTELERLADITSLPAVDARQVCAAAYLGRVACFDVNRGSLLWSRDIGSLGGIALDNRYLYITDDKGAVQALDKTTGSSVWKQDKLTARYPSGPVVLGDYLAVVDAEGWLHLLDRNDGSLVGRVATDGKAALSQPAAAGESAVWQSASNLISATASALK